MERRLAGVQMLVHGRTHQPFAVEALQSIYWEACQGYYAVSARDAALWTRVIQNLDVAQLLTLARAVQDPFCWMPFLVLLDYATVRGHDTDDATAHLLRITRELLDAQGLELLEPGDLMARPLAIQEAVNAIRS